jgi:type I restriction enzyme R subunit
MGSINAVIPAKADIQRRGEEETGFPACAGMTAKTKGERVAGNYTEKAFESGIESHLLASGWQMRLPAAFDATRALDAEVLLEFVQASQPQVWKTISAYHGAQAGTVLLDDLTRAITSQGMLTVLRHGFKCFGKLVRVAYFAPANQMNPETAALYAANRLTVMQQVRFSVAKPDLSLDMVLFLNGLPLITAELKNHMTGQTVWNAIRQYQNDREPDELLFRFNQRALVHFAVDPDLVYMTTKLEGKATWFLPFNQGNGFGAGNPLNSSGHKTAYLWEQVWQRDSLLDILGRFISLQVEEKDIPVSRNGKTTLRHVRKETLIFPRYHQLDAVRELTAAARKQGAGKQYLVQHSAGSGKSNTIAWLAHRLASLHDEKDGKIFDSVIVITDRRVLDKQLQDNIYQFEHKQGVVRKIDEDSAQLAEALKDQTPIIITTLQKFPFVTEKVGALPERRYAVIVDEAHSSQSGESAAELKAVLADAGLRKKAQEMARENGREEGLEDSDADAMLLTMLKRGRQPNISFFAFTATPKYKTLKIFDQPNPRTGTAPFHHYSMRQAIEEGFILDVLKNYVTYKTYFGLVNAASDDPEVPRKQAARQLARFMALHPHNLAQKTEVMVEHFRSATRHKIGGRAKAMVVTDSRLHALRYKRAFDTYITEKGYKDVKTLVAFSGTVVDPDFKDKSYTEEGMNGFRERELPEKFNTDEYQVLLVAEKYQTGFDQPLLHTMYVDKRLDGVQAVQTLSRLNRIAAGKEDTFVLDFRNERDDIFTAFKPYYETTDADEDVSAQKLYELKAKLDGAQIYFSKEVNEFCAIFFKARALESTRDHAGLNKILDPAVERFTQLGDEKQDEFKGWLVSFRNLYSFLSQVIPYQDSDLEKLYTYGRFLLNKLPFTKSDKVDLGDDVQLKYCRLQKISEGQIQLGTGEPQALYGPSEVGTGRADDERVKLSSLIEKLNDRFGTDFKPADQLFFDQIQAQAAGRVNLREAAKANTLGDFKLVFERELDDSFIERMEGNEDIFKRIMEDPRFREVASDYLLQEVYSQLRAN